MRSRSTKDARLAFYQTADAKKVKYDDLARRMVTELDPEWLKALIDSLIAQVENGCLAVQTGCYSS